MAIGETLKIVIVGHVDHGKSTLVGRLLHDTDSLPEGKTETLRQVSERRGMPFEWAFVVDALQAERDQGITIDIAHIPFKTETRPYIIIDAPGHKEFLKNMITGAASADAAVLVIDAREGVREQSRRHGYLLSLLGLSQIAVAVNKMDAVDFSQARFDEVAAEIRDYLAGVGVTPTAIVPVAARDGDNVANRSGRMDWYSGQTIIETLDSFIQRAAPMDLALRFPVQDVFKFDHRRIIAGRIESGRLKVGDRLIFSPSGKSARVATIEAWNVPTAAIAAHAGQSIGITLDEQVFIERGQIASHYEGQPVVAASLRARLFWLGRAPLSVGRRYKLKLATAEYYVAVERVERVIDVGDLSDLATDWVERNAVAEVVLRSDKPIAFDSFSDNPRSGRFVLIDEYDIVGGGVISASERNEAKTSAASNLTLVSHKVTAMERRGANNHQPGVLWLTGLSGAGKSSIAMEVERRLFEKGWQVFVLDGDNVRQGLNSDLGFSPEDRAENIRRVGEVAQLFVQAGMIVIASFISPYRKDRDQVRACVADRFHEVWVKADLATCERRDPKGLYGKARQGAVGEFTGVSAPYEAPTHPELIVDTDRLSLSESVERVLQYVQTDMQRESSEEPASRPDVAL